MVVSDFSNLSKTARSKILTYLNKVNQKQKNPIENVLGNEFFTRLAAKSRNVFWVRSADYKIQLYISPAYEEIWGRTCESAYEYPEKWIDTLHPDDRETLEKNILKRTPSMYPLTTYEQCYRIIRTNGEIRWIKDISFSINDDNGDCIGFAGIAEDITLEKIHQQDLISAKEKAEEANKLKTEFIKNMQHDIRTPFTGILGLTTQLLNDETDLTKRELLTDVIKCSEELLNYCTDIMDFGNLQTNELPILNNKFSINDLVKKLINIATPPAKLKQLKLEVDYSSNIPEVVIGDDYRLYRTLLNLVMNAIKFTKNGHVKFAVKLAKQIERQVILQFIIEDTGMGIPLERQNYIYESFTRLTPELRSPGLGLHIVKKFIEEMSGEIDLVSEIGRGTTFVCTLPFKLPLLNEYFN